MIRFVQVRFLETESNLSSTLLIGHPVNPSSLFAPSPTDSAWTAERSDESRLILVLGSRQSKGLTYASAERRRGLRFGF